jgi:hypothetical protein
MVKELGMTQYIECSALARVNVDFVLQQSIRAACEYFSRNVDNISLKDTQIE